MGQLPATVLVLHVCAHQTPPTNLPWLSRPAYRTQPLVLFSMARPAEMAGLRGCALLAFDTQLGLLGSVKIA